MPDDHAASIRTDGSVAVGGSATGDIETGNDRDWFAVELVAGRTYVFDLEGSPTGAGTLHDTYLRGIHDANGNWLSGTTNDDGGSGTNSRLTFTATESGTHYVATEGYGSGTGTYELSVRDTDPDTIPEPDTTPVPQTPQQTQAPTDADAARAGATDLGDITGLAGPAFPTGAIDGGADAVDYYRFTLTEAKQIGLGLRQQDTNADLFLEDAEGNVLHGSTEAGTASEGIGETLLAGTYYVRIETQEAGQNDYVFRYGVTAADPEAVRELERLLPEENAGQVPAFGQQDHVLALAENADGRTSRVSLGTVSATDPEGSTLAYSVVGGNEAGLFEIDAATGELFYAGSGEDYESGSTQFDLTVRASDGTQSTDTAVTVNVADVDETPTFNQQDYAFDLAENADGSTSRVSLGTVSATDPEGAALAYSVVGGNEAGLFGIDAASGELFYVGAGEDFESGSTQFELTVQASDGTVSSDSTVTVNVTDVLEVPAFGEQGYAFELAENTDGSTQRVSLGIVAAVDPDGTAVEYSLEAGNDSGLFQVEAATGELFYTGSGEDYESGTTPFALTVRASDGTLFTDMTVTVNVTDMPEQAIVEAPVAQTPQAGATDLGDITGLAGPAFPTGRLDGGADAVDYFRFTLTEAKRIGLGLRQQDTNADLLLEDAEGNVLHSSTEAGTASEWIGETLLAGTYYVRIETQEAGRNDYVFRYGVTAADPDEVARLQAQMETSEEYSADTGTAGRVAPGGSIASEVEQDGDQDWFAVDLTAGTRYRIDLKGSWTGDGTLWDPYLRGIYDSNGQLLSGTTDHDGGTGQNARVDFGATTDGTYYIAAGTNGSGTGTYTLSVAAIEDDFAAAPSTSGVVTAGGSATGEIEEPYDQDWFAVELSAGTRYRIDLEGRSTGDGTLWSPYLSGIYDSNGQLLSGTTDHDGGTGQNARVDFEAPTDGTYYVAAGAYNSHTGTYTLSVAEDAI